MIDADPVPPVENDELLARFIVNSNEFRPSDKTVKPKAFLPYKYTSLSVNRHRDSNEDEVWQVGRDVAATRKCTLYGRSDIVASRCRIDSLDVEAAPLPNNRNHANVIGYPATKEDQMSLAQKLAASAGDCVPPPDDG